MLTPIEDIMRSINCGLPRRTSTTTAIAISIARVSHDNPKGKDSASAISTTSLARGYEACFSL